MTASTLITAYDLEQMADDGREVELIRGMLVEMPPAGGIHLVVSGRLIRLVGNYLEATGRGEAGEGGFLCERDPDTVLAPDLAVILAADIPGLPEPGFIPFVPPLVAEVLSPSNRSVAVSAKIDIYRQAGVEAIWIIDPWRRQAHVLVAGEEQVLVEPAVVTGGALFPGLAVPLADLFRDLPLPCSSGAGAAPSR